MNVMTPALLHFSVFAFNWIRKTKRISSITDTQLIRLGDVRQVIKEELTPIPGSFPEVVKKEIEEFVKQFDALTPLQVFNQQEAFKKMIQDTDTKAMSNMAFENWMAELDAQFCAEYGLSVHDLPDMCYRDWFDSGMEPSEVMDEEFSDFETIQELIMG